MKRAIAFLSATLILLLAAGCSSDGRTPSSIPETSGISDITTAESGEPSSLDPTATGTGSETAGETEGSSGTTQKGGTTKKDGTTTKNGTTKDGTTKATTKPTPAVTLPGGGWTSSVVENYTPEELDQPYPLRQNIKGEVLAYTPFTGEVFDKAKAMFEKAYPGATVKFIVTNNVSRNEKLQMLVNSNSSPDYVYSTYQDYPLRAIRGMTMPIDDYIQDHPGQSALLMNNFAAYKGERYAVIQETPPSVMFYNTALFQRAGQKTPLEYYKEGNWTWDTLRAVAKQMTDTQNGIYGFATDLDFFFPLSVGQDVIKFVNGKAELNLVNNQKYIDAHNFCTDMINKDKSTYPTHWAANEQFTSGKCAMVLPNGDFKTICKDAGMTTYALVPFPRKDKNSPYYGMIGGLNGGFSIAKGSQNIEGGMAFGEMMINAQLELTGNMVHGKEEYEFAKECNMQYVVPWFYGYGLEGLYFQDLCGWARTGTKDLNTLINENAPLLEAKLKEITG